MRQKLILENIMAKKFPKLLEDISLEIKETQ